jgi:hypothetical protein
MGIGPEAQVVWKQKGDDPCNEDSYGKGPGNIREQFAKGVPQSV